MSSKQIKLTENGIHLVIEITEELDTRLLHFSSVPYESNTIKPVDDPALSNHEDEKQWFRLLELHVTGENHDDHHGSKHTGTLPGHRLIYKSMNDYRNQQGRKVEIILTDPVTDLEVTSHVQFYNGISVVKSWSRVENKGVEPQGIEYLSSFALTGLAKEGLRQWHEKMKIYVPHNTWTGEVQWKTYSLPDLGLYPVYNFSLKRIAVTSTGSWSSSEHLPMGYIENTDTGNNYFWQIEHNGSWHWEIGNIVDQLYIQLSGPTENESTWWKELKPGEVFESVPVSFGSTEGNFDTAMGELTRYRRAIRRKNEDNDKLPVIFNDYMNCLFGDPTTEKLIPLIDAAAEVGCEYFTIDAGWYADGHWWDGVGEWKPSDERFPGGIKEVIDYIQSKGMTPGLWLELEVMGPKCPLADQVPDDWFFCRHGKRILDRGRYQLDYRNKEVIKHATDTIDRLVNGYGVGYIKMDYNINVGIGTEVSSDSYGDGLLEHNRAYLNWLDKTFETYPDLVIENCGSGGMRMDYALLQRHSIQSVSDQVDYRKNAVIAAGSPSAVTPEQSAIWSYPLKNGTKEEVVFNMINAMLLRIHQSGHMGEIDPDRKQLVKEGIDYYKQKRKHIKDGLPFWPIGLPSFTDKWLSMGIRDNNKILLAVWRLNSEDSKLEIPIPYLKSRKIKVQCGYPNNHRSTWEWDKEKGALTVQLSEADTARLYEIDY